MTKTVLRSSTPARSSRPDPPTSGRLTEPGFEQHLVGLQEMGPHEEGPAVTELEARHLQLGAHALDDRPVLAQSNWNG